MIKKHKLLFAITSLVTLLPILAGVLLWDRLPQSIATHWNAQGVADGYSSKAVAVFGLPLVLLCVHVLCVAVTGADPKNKNITKKPLTLTFWITPAVSLVVSSLTYTSALGYETSIETILPLFLGVLFLVIGNYLPKCKQNYTIGIKIPWTLNDEENWNKTHRFAGIIWVAGSVIIMATAFIRSNMVMLPIMLMMLIAPVIYSYCYYKKHKKD